MVGGGSGSSAEDYEKWMMLLHVACALRRTMLVIGAP